MKSYFLKYFIKRNLQKITLCFCIILSIFLLHFYFKINYLSSITNLKDLEIKDTQEEKLTVIEKVQVQKMKELIYECSPNYFLGLYRIEEGQNYFHTVEIIGDQRYPDLSLKFLNQKLFDKSFKIYNENLKKINKNDGNFFIIKNFKDYKETLEILDLSKNNFDQVIVVVIKNPQGKALFMHSMVRIKDKKKYKCDEKDMANLLQQLTNNLLTLL